MAYVRALPLSIYLIALAFVAIAVTASASVVLSQWMPTWLAALSATIMVGSVTGLIIWRIFAPLRALFRALIGTVAAYRDGDFSFSIRWTRHADLIALVDAHNELGDTLRAQRVDLVQRELLLDTMIQNTPVAMILLDPSRRVVLGNLTARRLFGAGRKLEGRLLDTVLDGVPGAMRDAFSRGGDGVFSVEDDYREDIYQLSRRLFRLNGRQHELLLLRNVTAELRRAEVQTWKKVIRVISHELNNSLAPIASLAHSGKELLHRGQLEKLPIALTTIEERARHLERFLRDYARFAKIPAPRFEAVHLPAFIDKLRAQIAFVDEVLVPDQHAHFDPAQMEQVLLNLLKNAQESGTLPGTVSLAVRRHPDLWRFEVRDRGCGMNAAAQTNALLPFYSTKRSGTGLGLALAREIAEAHGGHIGLANRAGGGVCVWLALPTSHGMA